MKKLRRTPNIERIEKGNLDLEVMFKALLELEQLNEEEMSDAERIGRRITFLGGVLLGFTGLSFHAKNQNATGLSGIMEYVVANIGVQIKNLHAEERKLSGVSTEIDELMLRIKNEIGELNIEGIEIKILKANNETELLEVLKEIIATKKSKFNPQDN